jgi:hypothetical protein
MARPERFELPTYSSGGCRSIQLSYGRVPFSLHAGSGAIKCAERGKPPGCFTVACGRALPAIASAATAFASSAAAAATPATAPLRFGSRFVDVQSASTNLGAIQRRNRFVSFLSVGHLDKAETTRASRVAVGQNAHTIHLSVHFKHLAQFFLGRVEIQISNKDVLQAVASGVSYLSVATSAGKSGGA